MSEMPGPAVAVIARAPAQLAPMTMPSDAISSSACTTANVAFPVALSTRYFFRYPMSDSQSDDDGVRVFLLEVSLGVVPAGLERARVQRHRLGLLPELLGERLLHQRHVDAQK